MKYLIAGATGYLGRHLVQELGRRGLDFRAIARNPEKLEVAGLDATQLLVAEVTDPDSIKGCCEGVDVVISTVGITRQKDGLTYMDVDYHGNPNRVCQQILTQAASAVAAVANPRQRSPEGSSLRLTSSEADLPTAFPCRISF